MTFVGHFDYFPENQLHFVALFARFLMIFEIKFIRVYEERGDNCLLVPESSYGPVCVTLGPKAVISRDEQTRYGWRWRRRTLITARLIKFYGGLYYGVG